MKKCTIFVSNKIVMYSTNKIYIFLIFNSKIKFEPGFFDIFVQKFIFFIIEVL